ncbi:MAG: Trm112 family protein, partial [Gammaproteobacteria bacterium]
LYKRAEAELICRACRLAYPIQDDIPVMLEDEARRIPPDQKL